MIALFIIAFVLLAATAYTFYRRQHASSDYRAELQSRFADSPRSLFDHQAEHAEQSRLLNAAQASREIEEHTASLLERATAGDITTLAAAQRANDNALYGRVLQNLLNRAEESEANLRALAAFIANDSDLRGSPDLAAAYTKLWQQQPDRQTTAQLLHLAALSDDAHAFERAIVATTDSLRAGRLGEMRPEELSALIESEYWVLSSEARRTGAGFVLKQRMTSLRAELLAAASRKTESPNVES
ncbi:MAG TPA: hypothetical protein VGO96_12865 [Pyrinomonadaceae bacterium]|nr:hypothetical protein [Pyrinomonadaceae bacterium]